MIPYEKAHEIIEDCARMEVRAVQFTGGGEPTIHPRFWDLLSFAQSLDMATGLVTNGVKLKQHSALSRLSWVRISLDAATKGTYAKIRNVPDWHFDAATNGIKLAVEANGPVVGVGFVVTKDNYHEILDAANYAKALGAANIRIGGVFQNEGADYFNLFRRETESLVTAAESLSDNRFTVFNRFKEKLTDLEQGAPDYEFCGYQRFTTYIGGDLNVYRCCTTAYNKQGLLGSLEKQSFYNLWFGEGRDKLEKFDARTCSLCQFNGINRNIIGMLKKPPHAEFV
jgi:MoaA/NifB/PqqE/SkfB family radical SAM enzyme